MKGLPTSSRYSNCFSYNQIRSILTRLCFCCPFQTPTRSTENDIRNEKQYRHVPTHAASSFLRTTTPPTFGPTAEPILDDIALRDLDPDVAASEALSLDIGAQGESVRDRVTLNGLVPGTIVSNESPPDEPGPNKALSDSPGLDELPDQAEQPRSESPTLGGPMSGGLT